MTQPGPYTSDAQAVFLEMIFTFFLSFMIFTVTDEARPAGGPPPSTCIAGTLAMCIIAGVSAKEKIELAFVYGVDL